MAKKYELNEEDIEKTIRYLKIVDPENASPEKAIERLEELRAGYHHLSHDHQEFLIKLKESLDKKPSA